MRSLNYHCTLLFILLITSTLNFHAIQATEETEENGTETNEIIPREAIEKLDFSVRQALLRAIDKLEQEVAAENDKQQHKTNTIGPSTIRTNEETITTPTPLTSDTKDEILDESVPADDDDDVLPTVQFFTATIDEKSTREQPLYSFIDHSKSVKKFSKLQKSSNFDAPVVVAETEQQQQQTDNHQTARSVGGSSSSVRSNEISNDQSDEITFEIRSSKNQVITTTTTATKRPPTTRRKPPTTTTTTTTTTPRPTHNEDGENIEVVDKQDIKIQEAPLVTAFTVDLDERGTAKKVVPIIHAPESTNMPRHRSGPTITKLNVLPGGSQTSPNIFPTVFPTQATQQTTLTNLISTTLQPPLQPNIDSKPQGNVNNFLIERQRQLEQQIYQLKLQAQQQQELILRQLKLLEQQTQLQPKLLATTNQANLATPNQQQLTLQTALQQQQQIRTNTPDLGFTIRPSVEFLASTQTQLPSIGGSPFPAVQQLPLSDFPNNFNNHNKDNFNQNTTPNNNNNNNNILPIQTQQLPLNNPVRQIFHNLQNLKSPQSHVTAAPTSLAPTTVQIQASNQYSFAPTFAPALQPPPPKPLELAGFQSLPQHNFQQFQQQQSPQQQLQPQPLVPSYVTDAILQQQQQQRQKQLQPQQQPQQQQHHRFFRQESGTGNFGVNQVQIQSSNSYTLPDSSLSQQTLDNQNFYRQNLEPRLSNQLQQNAQQYYQQQQQQQQKQHQKSATALNHGINAFGAQNLRFNGPNGF